MMNHTELAKALGISREMVHRHVKTGRLTPESGGGFDPDKAKAQLAANVKQKHGGSPRKSDGGKGEPPKGPTLAKAQLAHELVKVKKASLEVGQLEGTLVNLEEVSRGWAGKITEARNAFLAIEGNARTRFGEEVGDWLKAEIRKALYALAGTTEAEQMAELLRDAGRAKQS
jgi:hypothetical protein